MSRMSITASARAMVMATAIVPAGAAVPIVAATATATTAAIAAGDRKGLSGETRRAISFDRSGHLVAQFARQGEGHVFGRGGDRVDDEFELFLKGGQNFLDQNFRRGGARRHADRLDVLKA